MMMADKARHVEYWNGMMFYNETQANNTYKLNCTLDEKIEIETNNAWNKTLLKELAIKIARRKKPYVLELEHEENYDNDN